jgi:hypothetical protein
LQLVNDKFGKSGFWWQRHGNKNDAIRCCHKQPKDTKRNTKCKEISVIVKPIELVKNVIKLLSSWYLTSRSEYEAAGAGIGAAWRETLGKNFPPSTLLYIAGLVDERAKVEIEVTAFVPAAEGVAR